MGNEITIGGQAVIEGVMMRSKTQYAIAVRNPEGKIITKIMPIKKNESFWYNTPVIRGIVRFWETLIIGIKSLEFSASQSTGEEEEISAKELGITIAFSLLLTVGLFYLAPLFLTKLITNTQGLIFNLLDGIFRLLIFLAYLFTISLFPDIRRIFQYHGAEHKAVFCYEHNEKLTVENVQKYSTLHPRCGTNFILIVFVISILVFSIITSTLFWQKLMLRIILIPLIAGLSYEVLKFAGKHYEKTWVKVMIYPGLMLQKITTKQPDDDMVEVAIKALKSAL